MTKVLSVNIERVEKPGWLPQTRVTITRACGHTTNWAGPSTRYPRVGRASRCISCHLDLAEHRAWVARQLPSAPPEVIPDPV